ncbi:5-oxoprolinase subunit PxpB [Hyphococcus luteus]|uniref:Kinase inhibitor n=1 Tax=Hyphococcus luteus TaxID=2058213 RepID=A0A2S7K658_9PROT|nr:5-oxoprolinase subunit PxpB [Marinicaulis flavus]PQA87961.1 kinase inhibitor [Marinicaulis flavus]
MSALSFEINAFGEATWLARLHGRDMIATALAANLIADRLRPSYGVTDCVAGVDSVVLRFDPSGLAPQTARAMLEDAVKETPLTAATPETKIEIPVCYGGEYGPDLAALAQKLSLSEAGLIERHAAQKYRVLTIGFAPGFAYLGPLPESLQTSRLASPRTHVPAGSVGVAGAMTGVYPLASPGGWPLIGRTPKKLFNAKADAPFIFTPGAEVSFTPVSEDAFARMQDEAA